MFGGYQVPKRAAARGAGDGGFTMLEMVVSAAVMCIVLMGLGAFFVQAMSTSHLQGQQQASMRLAADAMDALRAPQVAALLSERAPCAAACPAPVAKAAPLLAGIERWDAAAAPTFVTTAPSAATTSFPVPPSSSNVTVNGLTYQRYLYLGKCWEQTGGGACTADDTQPIAMVRAVVGVAWPSHACANGACSFATSTLFGAGGSGDPVFSSGAVAVTAVADQVTTLGSAIAPLPLSATGGTQPYTWSVTGLPTGLTFDPATTSITGTPTSAGKSTVTVTVTDARGRTAKDTFVWTVVTKLTLAKIADQGTTQGRSVTLSPSAAGGTTPYTWSANGLPRGLSIDSTTGAITGTPDTLGASTVTVTVTDARKQSVKVSFVWTIYSAPQLAVPPKQDTYIDTAAVPLQMVATDGVGPYTWTATSLRAGMSIGSSTGVISGTPLALGTSHVVVTVTDSRGESASVTFDWSIDKAQQLYDPTTTQLIVANPSLYTWSAVNLPPGLSINSATGLVSGTPTTAGTWDIQILLTDAGGTVKKVPFKWTIYAPLTLTSPGAQSSSKGKAIPSLQPTQTGGVGPFTWSVSGLPAGLSIDANTGVITGKPTTVGTSTVYVTVTDYAGNRKTTSFTWQVS
ncbi:putative Ig domain-containing protein [Actinoplanes ianthinogenes]|uniref:putative Ig domain-containing protein n=1 Tax=Actinoplanes ianthinogenes TaxID=122358 RepID=UPI001E386AE6|nr:putative Ig domain-containing protein [Actinoplanes ianthinogenes]